MHIRKSFAALCASLLAATLLGLGLSWSAWHVVSQPDYVKKTLSQSGIYDTITQNILKQKESDLASSTGLSANDPQMQGIISQAVSPLVQGQTEKVIDSGFGWLEGTSSNLDTSLDLSSAQQKIADGLADYTKNRLASLPVCTADTINTTSSDPLQATCLPPGFDIDAAANQTKANVLDSSALKDDTAVNLNDVQTPGGSTLQQQLQSGPRIYKKIQLSLYLQGALTLLVAVGLVFLSRDWRIGIRRVGIIALWTGAINVILAWLSSFGMHVLAKKLAQTGFSGQPIQQKLVGIAQVVVDDIRTWWLYYGLALIVIGLVLLLVYRLTKQPAAAVAASLAKEEGVDVSAAKLAAVSNPVGGTPSTLGSTKPALVKTPDKKPRKIQ